MTGSVNFHFDENAAAFEQNPGEAERILTEAFETAQSMFLHDEVPIGGKTFPLIDLNGNKVGEVHVHPQ